MKQKLESPAHEPNVVIRQIATFNLIVDGVELPGTFKVDSEWEGFVKLRCDSPCSTIIIRKPHVPHINIYDLIPKLFGGKRESNKPLEIKAEEV